MSLIVAALLSLQDQRAGSIQLPPPTLIREMRLSSIDLGTVTTLIQARGEKLDPPKLSPLNGWMFEHATSGFARDKDDENFNLRVQVFNQYRSDENDPTDDAARMLMRLWDLNRWRLGIDHPSFIHLRSIDVYLCAGGAPGAEQKVLEDPYQVDASGRQARVSNIYIYSVPTLTDRLEFARELAHEYGHATWPPFGHYEAPEEWVSGDMGERVFLTWLLQAVQSKKLTMKDVMNAPLADLQKYYDVRVLPDLKRVALNGPDAAKLARRDKGSYAEVLGLVSYLGATLPGKVFGRALLLAKDMDAGSLPGAVSEALKESKFCTFTVPEGLGGTALWIPSGGRITKGAKSLRQEGQWLKVQPTAASFTVSY